MAKIILILFLLCITAYSEDRYFDGDDCIETSTSIVVASNVVWTIEMNIKPHSFRSEDSGKGNLYYQGACIYFQLRGDGAYVGKLATHLGAYKYGTNVLKLNQWQHVAYTYERSKTEGKFYIDGKLDSTHSGSSAAMGGAGIFIACESLVFRFSDVELDNIRRWNYARTITQINSFMWTDITWQEDGLVQNLLCNEETGRLQDVSGYGHHVIEVGGTTSLNNAPTRRVIGD